MPRWRRSRTARSRAGTGERGAVAVFTAALMALLLAFAAFAVDLGTQRVAVRDMQALADVVALDAARLLDGRTAKQVRDGDSTHPALAAVVTASRARNDDHVVGEPTALRVRPYLVALAADGTFARDPLTHLPVEVAPTTVARAVVVEADTRVDFGFARIVGVSSGPASRSAVGSRATPSVCFSVGTRALTLDTAQSALSPLLSQVLRVNLSAVGYDGLIALKDVSVPIAGVLARLNVGSVDQLATTNVTLASFLVAAADVAQANGATASANALRAVRLGVPGQLVNLGRILALQTGTDVAGLTSSVDLLGIVGAAVVAANGQNAVALGVPGLADLKIIQPPQIACGVRGATASSAQVDLHIKPSLVADAGLGLLGGSTDVTVRVGGGSATIATDLSCAPESVTLDVRTAGAEVLAPVSPPVPPPYGQVQLRVTLAKFLSFLGPLSFLTNAALSLLGLNEVVLDVLVAGAAASSTSRETITYPAAPALPATRQVPASGLGTPLVISAAGFRVNPNQTGLLSVLGGVIAGATTALLNGLVTPIVNTVVSPVLGAVLNPVLATLGIKLGVAEVTMLGRPVCSGSRLVG